MLLSELYVLGLAADCCSSHWTAVDATRAQAQPQDLKTWQRAPSSLPDPLEEALVNRIFEITKLFISPVPEGYMLSPSTILDDSTAHRDGSLYISGDPLKAPPSGRSDDTLETTELLDTHVTETWAHVETIVEYVTASSWPAAFDYFRNVIFSIRTTAPTQAATTPSPAALEEERSGLVILRLLSSFWVDRQKLGQVIQELCSSFLHFRKPFQNTIAVVAPLLITRWVERHPQEFIQLHATQSRMDGGPDTLFDMTQTVVDNGRKKGLLYPLQTALVLLLPDVFEVASNLREAKTGSVAKKVAFLDSLRKALRNRNEQAAYCLVSLLRAARHFDAESDSALMSYAMDVQDEVRDAVFRRFPTGADGFLFEQDILTAAFVSLTYLNFDVCVDSLAPSCLVSAAPQGLKIAVIQACSHFARQPNSEAYQALFDAAAGFVQDQLKASIAQSHFA